MKTLRYAAQNVNVREGKVRAELNNPQYLGRLRYEIADEEIILDVPETARYAISKTEGITIEPFHTASQRAVETYLEGIALPLFAMLRGVMIFHGSAVEASGGGLVLLGPKGAGKSTTAAALAHAGCKVLCDDAVPILLSEGKVYVAPAIPKPMLLADAFLRLSGNPGNAEAVARLDGESKYEASVPAGTEAVELKAIFILGIAGTAGSAGDAAGSAGDIGAGRGKVAARKLSGVKKVTAAMAHAISLPGLEEPSAAFMRQLELLRHARVFELMRPASEDSLDEIVDTILRLAAH